MRQWLLDPIFMCGKHIRAEHLETHMFLSAMDEGRSLQGFYDHGLYFGPRYLITRHDLLVMELDTHNTPLDFDPDKYTDRYPDVVASDEVVKASNSMLLTRCQGWDAIKHPHSRCNDWRENV
jgi:hypothetical protein